MKTRTYKDLQNIMTDAELDQFAKKMAEEYAESECQYSRSYFTKVYNITSECFYKLLYRAVVHDLVDDETVRLMRIKASRNSNLKSAQNVGKGTVSSETNYIKLVSQRKWFIFLRDFPKDKKVEITTYFAEHFEESKAECAEKFGVSKVAFDRIMEDTLVNNEVGDEIFTKIRERSLKNNDTKAVRSYFTALRRKRNANKGTAS